MPFDVLVARVRDRNNSFLLNLISAYFHCHISKGKTCYTETQSFKPSSSFMTLLYDQTSITFEDTYNLL
jgi:hypothetical protein